MNSRGLISPIYANAGRTMSDLLEDLMPSKSAKQARTMAAAAHNPEFARKVGIPQTVAREFNKADAKKGKGKKPGKSGY